MSGTAMPICLYVIMSDIEHTKFSSTKISSTKIKLIKISQSV
jgi:hypothetical protein